MAWAYVQGGIHQNGSTNTATTAVTLGAAVGSGNLVCVTIGYAGTSSDTLTVADNKGNTYTAADKLTNTSGYAWFTFYCAGITNGPTTITATDQAGAVSFSTIIVDEFSGGGSGAILDGHAIASYDASSTPTDAVSSGSFTTTTNGDLIYGTVVNINSTGAPTAGTGFNIAQSDVATFSTDYKTQATAGSTAATFTLATSTRILVAGMAFKAASGVAADNASGSATLGALTSTGTATVKVSGTASATLAAMTSAATAGVTLKASGSATLAGLTSSGSAVVLDAVTGASTFDPLTSAASARIAASASGVATFDAMTSIGAGVVIDRAQGGSDLGLLMSSGSATVINIAAGAATLAPLTSSATAVHFVLGRSNPAALLI